MATTAMTATSPLPLAVWLGSNNDDNAMLGNDSMLGNNATLGGIVAERCNDMRGDDANRPSPDRLFDVTIARREGRGALITYLEAATAAGVAVDKVLP